MNAKKLIPFAIILAILGGLVLLRNSKNRPESIVEQVKLEALIPADTKESSIQRLKLFAGAKPEEHVELLRDGAEWKVATAYNAPVDPDSIDPYLKKLVGLKGEVRARNVSGDALAKYQLKDDEAFHIQAFTGSGDTPAIEVLVGKAADYQTVFMRPAGSTTVYVETANLRTDAGVFGDDMTVTPKADKWLNKKILSLDDQKITKIAINSPDKSLVFERREKPKPEKTEDTGAENTEEKAPEAPAAPEYEWVLTAGGVERPFKEAALTSLKSRFKSFLATTVADPAKKAEYGLENPAFSVTLSVEGQDDVTLNIGRPSLKEKGYVVVAGRPQELIYEVQSFSLDQLFPKGSELFDDLPKLELNQNDIAQIAVEQPQGRVVIAKEGDTWKIIEPAADLEPQSSKLSSLPAAAARFTPADYSDHGPAPEEYNRSVTITMKDGATHRILAAGDAKSIDGVYAKIEGNDRTLVMSRADAVKFWVLPKDMYQLAVFQFDDAAANSIEIQHGGTAFSLSKTADGWQVHDGDKTFPANQEAVEEFLGTFISFQASDIDTKRSAPDWIAEALVNIKTADDGGFAANFGPESDGMHPLSIAGKKAILSVNKAVLSRITSQFDALRTPPAPPAAAESAPADATAESAPSESAASEQTAPSAEAPAEAAAAQQPEPSPAPSPGAPAP